MKKELDDVKKVLQKILDLWPYINCVCGRNKLRISSELRSEVKNAIQLLEE